MTRALSGYTSVDHVDGRLIITIHDSQAFRGEAETGHDGVHILSMLCGGCSGKELRFSGAGSSDGLHFASVGDGAATEDEGVACTRSAVAQIISVCGINK